MACLGEVYKMILEFNQMNHQVTIRKRFKSIMNKLWWENGLLIKNINLGFHFTPYTQINLSSIKECNVKEK